MATKQRTEHEEPNPTPTEEEVEKWAKVEQQRRQAWFAGPTEEEKAAWVRRERRRRRAHLYQETEDTETERLAMRLRREHDLAMIGAFRSLVDWPFRRLARLVQAGRDWEEEYMPRSQPRSIAPEDDEGL